jgi:hypothetical protein
MQVSEIKNRQHFTVRTYQKGLLNLYLFMEEHCIQAAIFNDGNTELYEICSFDFAADKKTAGHSMEELAYFLSEFGILKHKFNHVSVQVLNRLFTLVPQAYSDPNLKELLEFNTGAKDIRTVQTNLVNNSVYFTYTYDLELLAFIEKTFSAAKIDHVGAGSIDLFLNLPYFKNSDVFLILHSTCLELIIKSKNDLLFYNIFKFDSNEDVLYFLLFTAEQFQLNKETLRLQIAANKPANDELFTLIKKYIRHVNFVSSKALNTPVEDLPNHFYFNILNKHLCEF